MSMEENLESPFEQFEKRTIIRRKLLPWWIKTFCWIFMIMGSFAVGGLLFGVLGYPFDLSIYGFQTVEPLSIMGLLITGVLIFKGLTAFALYFERDHAINLAKIDAIAGIVLCMLSMVVWPIISEHTNFSFRLEILLLIPYFLKINKIEYEWDN